MCRNRIRLTAPRYIFRRIRTNTGFFAVFNFFTLFTGKQQEEQPTEVEAAEEGEQQLEEEKQPTKEVEQAEEGEEQAEIEGEEVEEEIELQAPLGDWWARIYT